MSVVSANQQQKGALNPRLSVWVSASAGSGKTEILTRRILALLLHDPQLEPRNILALTFTKAGAAEMAARLPDRLAQMAALSDEVLAKKLLDDLDVQADATVLQRVRMLASVVESAPPMISTIHGLAQQLLTYFPVEAGAPNRFTVMEQAEQERLLEQIQLDLLQKTEGPLADSLARLMGEMADTSWRDLTKMVIRQWRQLREILADGGVAGVMQRLNQNLQLQGNEGWAFGLLLPKADEWAAVMTAAEILPNHKVAAIGRAAGEERERLWCDFLLTKEDTARSALFVKADMAKVPEDVVEVLRAAQVRVAGQLKLRRILRGRDLTEALLVWAMAIKASYLRQKESLGVLDFDDLLEGLNRLLNDSGNEFSEWVNYVMDRRFLHVLLDEGQDNNPQQDRIMQNFVRQLMAGEVEGRNRTVLAVGDVKQSIYRFQGAVPELFLGLREQMRAWGNESFGVVEVKHNFRSGGHIMGAVNEVFAGEQLAAEVQGEAVPWPIHEAVRTTVSRVEIWPLIEAEEGVQVRPWALPQERWELSGQSNEVAFFERLAGWLIAQKNARVMVPANDKPRPLEWSDVLVLVQKNKTAGIAAGVLGRAGIPVNAAAGVQDQAVDDVVALLRVVFSPADRVALATVLKGLFGWDDGQIMAFFHDRTSRLSGNEEQAVTRLKKLAQQGVLPLVQAAVKMAGKPLALFEPLLEWAEAAESLPALIARLEREDLPIRSAGNGVRVMTVHGAKGLEAPLVVMADTMRGLEDISQDKFLWGQGTVLIRQGKGLSLFEDTLLADEQQRRRRDNLRALYVAMTRARDWLVVAGWGKRGEKDTWWTLVNDALGPKAQQQGEILVYGDGLEGLPLDKGGATFGGLKRG